jgi:hypothetical protein
MDAKVQAFVQDNALEGIVTLYGRAPARQELPISQLYDAFTKPVIVQTTGGSLALRNNRIALLSIGRDKIADLIKLATGVTNTIAGVFETAALDGNVFVEPDNIFVTSILTLASSSFLGSDLSRSSPYGDFVAESATVVGNATVRINADLLLRVVTVPGHCKGADDPGGPTRGLRSSTGTNTVNVLHQ